VYRCLARDVLPSVRITEINKSGSVPELVVDNQLDRHLYLMDGQELIGAKQNRILNTDVLAPPMQKTTIPVSCVEQGRWSYRSAGFTPGRSANSRMRLIKQAHVHAALQQRGRHDADQSAVWSEVAESMSQAQASSDTMALTDVYATRQRELKEMRRSLRLPRKAVGVAVFNGGQWQGLDLFDRHATLKYFWNTLIDSYGLDYLGRHVVVDHCPTEPDKAWSQLRQAVTSDQWEHFPSPGDGEDWRLRDRHFAGSALVWQEQSVIHLQLFPAVAQQPSTSRPASRIRRRYMERPSGDADRSSPRTE